MRKDLGGFFWLGSSRHERAKVFLSVIWDQISLSLSRINQLAVKIGGNFDSSQFCCRSRGCGEEGLMQTDGESKTCCGLAVSQTVSIRWFIVMIAFVGICCSVVGTVLGAMKAQGREHLTVSLLMIGENRFFLDPEAFCQWHLRHRQ